MLRAVLALLLAASAAGSAAASTPRTYVPALLRGGSAALVVRPQRLIVAGDGTAVLTRIRYRSYGGPSARATGALLVDDCRPSCADGTFHSVSARLLFAGAVRCHGKRVYTTVRVHAPGAAQFNGLTDRTVALAFLADLCEPGDR